MMGQDTDFGQMECLKLITANTFIEKRIGYLGTFAHPRRPHPAVSRALVVADDGYQPHPHRPHQLRTPSSTQNNYVVALTLSVLSEICTAEMSKEIAPLIITVRVQTTQIISNGNAYIKKKAILTATKIIRRSPELISEFLPKIENCMMDKQHGVLLGAIAFLESAITVD